MNVSTQHLARMIIPSITRSLIVVVMALFCVSVHAQVAVEWQKCLGTVDNDELVELVNISGGGFAAAGSVYITGVGYNYLLVRTDPFGNQLWVQEFGGSGSDEAYDLAELPGGGFLIAGGASSNDGDVTGAHGGNDGWVVRVDASGNIIWQKPFGGTGNDYFLSCILLNNGNYLVSGYSNSTNGDLASLPGGQGFWLLEMDSSGNIINQVRHNASAILGENMIQTSDGGFMATGRSSLPYGIIITNYGNNDMCVVKLDSAYNVEWVRIYGGTQTDCGNAVMETTTGEFVVAGYTGSNDLFVSGNHGFYDYWVVKLDTMGNFLWQKCLGGTGYDYGLFGVFENDIGQYLVAGSSNGSTGGNISHPIDGYDFWIAGLDTSGSLLWERSMGGGRQEYPGALLKMPDGALVLSGSTYSNDYDVSGRIGPLNQPDGWLVQFRERPNIIKGICFVDLNSNGTLDSSEFVMPLHDVKEQASGQHTLTYASGHYELFLPYPGSYTVTADTFPYFNCVPAAHNVVFTATNQVDSLNDFAFQPIPGFTDLEITATLNGVVRPGFTSNVQLVYRNVATVTMSGEVTLAYPSIFTYSTAMPAPFQVGADTIRWNYSGLQPYQSDTISVDLVTAIPSLGTPFTLTASVHPIPGDMTPLNNTDTITDVVVGSFDPNDIAVDITSLLPSQVMNPPFLEYLIRFQNTGTFPATFIEVVNPVSSRLDMSTFELIGTSHSAAINYLAHSGNLDFFFDNINLPDSVSNEPGSHGFIRYRVRPFPTLAIGDSIFNSANIYFDYNPAVVTNVVATVVENPLFSEPVPQPAFRVSAFPNPFGELVHVEFSAIPGQEYRIRMLDVLGRERFDNSHVATGVRVQETISAERMATGVYFLEVSGPGGRVTRKLVRQ